MPSPCRGAGQALDLLHFCRSLPEPVTLIARLRLDAGLYDPAPPRQPGQTGRPRVKGSRQPTLKQLLDVPELPWLTGSVPWYDGATRNMELVFQTALGYHWGKPHIPIRWVLIRDPKGELDTQALLCTDQAAPPAQIFEWFSLRWQLEVTYQEVRIHLGVDTQRQWSDRAIARTTPILMGLFPGSPWPLTHFSRAVQSPSAPRLGTPNQRLPCSACSKVGSTPVGGRIVR